jgi:hypothetical protein
MTVGVAIPSIPPRGKLLKRALTSVQVQTHPVDQINIAYDTSREGAGATRNRAKNSLTTDYIAFLDDDDEMLPHHIEVLLGHIEYHQADVAFSWFTVVGGTDPFPDNRWKEFDPASPHTFGITALVRREVAQSLDFEPPSTLWEAGGEDWTWWTTLAKNGAKFVNTSDITWRWHHHGLGAPGRPGNTSGRNDRW